MIQVALYSGSISRQGNPSPWSLIPYFGKDFTQDMNFFQRLTNVACLSIVEIMHWIMTTGYIQPTLRKYLGKERKVERIFYLNLFYYRLLTEI